MFSHLWIFSFSLETVSLPCDSVAGITFQKRAHGYSSAWCAWEDTGHSSLELIDLCFSSLMKRQVGWLKGKCQLIISEGINKNHLEHMNCMWIIAIRGVCIFILSLIFIKNCKKIILVDPVIPLLWF